MEQILHKYMVLNKGLTIPALGSFTIEPLSAQIDAANSLLHAPGYIYRFKHNPTAVAEKSLVDFIASENEIDEIDAAKQIHHFSADLLNASTAEHGIAIKGIGNIKKEANGSFLFLADRSMQEYFPQIKLNGTFSIPKPFEGIPSSEGEGLTVQKDIESLLTQQDEEEGIEDEQDDTDYWWMYVVVLLLIGVGAILFYYV
jgi:hypothetical protein